MKSIQKTVIGSILILIGIILLFYLASDVITKYTGFSIAELKTEDQLFKECLKEKNAALYINTNNINETLKSIGLSDYKDSIKIINCLGNKNFCESKKINVFPTIIINENIIQSKITIEQLKEISGCE